MDAECCKIQHEPGSTLVGVSGRVLLSSMDTCCSLRLVRKAEKWQCENLGILLLREVRFRWRWRAEKPPDAAPPRRVRIATTTAEAPHSLTAFSDLTTANLAVVTETEISNHMYKWSDMPTVTFQGVEVGKWISI